jgi:hypothetical protein
MDLESTLIGFALDGTSADSVRKPKDMMKFFASFLLCFLLSSFGRI